MKNRKFEIGDQVLYFPLVGSFDFEKAVVRSEPWKLGHGAEVVLIEGRAGGVATSHLRHLKKK